MGITESNQSNNFSQKPVYYGEALTQQHGKVAIYKLEDIFIQHTLHSVQSDQILETQLSIFRVFQRQEKHFQKIFDVKCNKNLMCQKDYQIHIMSNYYSYTLHDLIVRKKELNSEISTPELWYIIRSVAEAGAFLQKKNLVIGDIRPNTIYISHQHNIRIPVIGILPNCSNSCFYKSYAGMQQGCFLAPEQLIQLKTSKLSKEHNHFKSDVWALGITVLECISKISASESYYSYNSFSVNFEKIKFALSDLECKNMKQILGLMLTLEQKNRPDFKKLTKWLDSHEIIDTYILSVDQKELNATMSETYEHTKEKKKISLKK